MKHGTRPTRDQKKALSKNSLDAGEWLCVGGVGTGWQFRSRDESRVIVCYPDKNGIYEADGVTLAPDPENI